MDNKINAYPLKEFFIDMLTRDIKLEKAILDLIDNSIDGAKNIESSENFQKLWIKIELNSNSFTIHDNCGGFSLATAKEYAFRFGRPNEQTQNVKHSVGRFGVGMKRALFKIGKKFTVESKFGNEHFAVEVDVSNWSQTNEWVFEFKEGTEISNPMLQSENGTFIKVEELYTNISEEFGQPYFTNNFISEIGRFMYYSLEKGIRIYLNQTEVLKQELKMYADKLQPISIQKIIGDVTVRIIVGIGEASPEHSGWYIYCNDRLVLEKDKTNLTGWEGRIYEESKLVKWHHTYAMFRGIVFFDANDSRLLPMTTTKIGIDANSAIYRSVKLDMIHAMTQIIGYLKKLQNDDDREQVTADMRQITITEIKQLPENKTFENAPLPERIKAENKLINISYKKDKREVEKVKKVLGVSSVKEVGEKTFEYYLKMEVE